MCNFVYAKAVAGQGVLPPGVIYIFEYVSGFGVCVSEWMDGWVDGMDE